MPTDPRLNSLVQFAQNAATGNSQAGVIGVLRSELVDHGQRISALERAATIQTGSGAPSQPARDGTAYGQSPNTLWLRLNGVWRGVNLPL